MDTIQNFNHIFDSHQKLQQYVVDTLTEKKLVSSWINYVLQFFLCFLYMHMHENTHTQNIGGCAGLYSFTLWTVTAQAATSLLCQLQHKTVE